MSPVRRLVPAPLRVPLTAAVVLVTAAVVLVTTVDLPSRASAPRTPVAAAAPAAPPVLPQAASRARPVTVAPLRGLLAADLMLTTRAPLTPQQVARLSAVRGVKGSTAIATGTVHVGTRSLSAMGVDPSSFRRFTPRETARSDALWTAVARGDVAASYAAKLALGSTVRVVGRRPVESRIGALAAYDLPGSGVVVDRSVAASLGLTTNTLLLAAPDRSIKRLKAQVRAVVGPAVTFTVLRPEQVVQRRPKTYRELYQLSARYCPGLSWTVLAAIGQVESGHGRNVGPSSAGALGPMQFLPATWAAYGVDGDGDGKADIMSAYDAVPAASLYLCRNGAGRGGQALYDAIFAYNHADWYVREVLDLAARYR